MSALQQIDEQTRLTRNQKLMVAFIIAASCFEFFDLNIIGFVIPFISKPWNLTFGISSVILLSSGAGGIVGPVAWGQFADSYGRRPTFVAIVLTFSLGSLALAFTPEGGWVYMTALRFVVGFGVGGFVVFMPYIQEFLPKRRRGFVASLVSVFIPGGLLIGSLVAGYLTPIIGWRGLFAFGTLPIVLLLAIPFIPESPLWALNRGRTDQARAAIAWALQMRPEQVELGTPPARAWEKPRARELLHYPRCIIAIVGGNLGALTGAYGIAMWGPTLLMLVLATNGQHAARLMIGVALCGMIGRALCGYLSDIIGRRACGAIFYLTGAVLLVAMSFTTSWWIGPLSVFWLMFMLSFFFFDGGFSINGPYAAELWPSRLRSTGMGMAYGLGGIGKVIGPLGLALIVGSSNLIKPEVMVNSVVPALGYLAAWFVLAGIAYGVFGIETKGRSFEEIDQILEARRGAPAARRVAAE